MVRFLVRMLLSPLAISIFNIVILFPLVIAILEVALGIQNGGDFHEPMDILEGMGVVLIGWGVALEERHSLRHIFGLAGEVDENRQAAIDHSCHSAGLGMLIFGLFAEMCVEAVRLPNHIINTHRIEHVVLYASLAFLVISVYVMLHHIYLLVRVMLAGKQVVSDLHESH
ncbi:MAG: hypothetical protein JSR90_12105 [Proteobacteria bacterium]|nr:hypothetical protein [Pseudomonadota bacterium]